MKVTKTDRSAQKKGPLFNIEGLTQIQAEVIHAITGRIQGGRHIRETTDAVYYGLYKAGVNVDDSDTMFDGYLTVKEETIAEEDPSSCIDADSVMA